MISKPFTVTQALQPVTKTGLPEIKKKNQPVPFQQILEKEITRNQDLKFSRHARERLDARKIVLNEEQVGRLHSAVEKAQHKGCRESLVLLDDLAFVVSISNRTVITAVNGENVKENIFTNIDSAVIN